MYSKLLGALTLQQGVVKVSKDYQGFTRDPRHLLEIATARTASRVPARAHLGCMPLRLPCFVPFEQCRGGGKRRRLKRLKRLKRVEAGAGGLSGLSGERQGQTEPRTRQ